MNLYVIAPSPEALDAEQLSGRWQLARSLELDEERPAAGDEEDLVWPAVDSPLDSLYAKPLIDEPDDSSLDPSLRTRHRAR